MLPLLSSALVQQAHGNVMNDVDDSGVLKTISDLQLRFTTLCIMLCNA